jgi:hypothetical protein
MTDKTEQRRHASPQAWRRVRYAIGPGEVRDLAADIAMVAGGDPEKIAYALADLDWSRMRQG